MGSFALFSIGFESRLARVVVFKDILKDPNAKVGAFS